MYLKRATRERVPGYRVLQRTKVITWTDTREKDGVQKEFAEAIKGHRNSVVQGTGEKESYPMGF